jgi:hypothetical protein
MPVAKHSYYARLRSRTERPRQIDVSAFAYLCGNHEEMPHALLQHASAPQSSIVSASAPSRSIYKTVAQLADAAGDILLAIATWMIMEILVGCLAYARAMHGLPEAIDHGKSGDPVPSAPATPIKNPLRPALRVVSADTEGVIRTGDSSSLSVRPE